MKFVADGMLGKLARWLRMLGHDVKYSNKSDDAELEVVAKEEHRVLLTRDLELYRHATSKGIDAFYVEGETEAQRIAELARRFNIPLAIDLQKSRCPKCNSEIQSIPKEKVADSIEPNTFNHYDAFWKCPQCGQIYWQGAHWVKIRAVLEEAEENSKKMVET